MADVIIFKLNTLSDYDQWYDFLNWQGLENTQEIGSWDDRDYSNIMYKVYRIDDSKNLSYILLKWDVIYKGDYNKWIQTRDKISRAVYRDKDIKWIDKND